VFGVNDQQESLGKRISDYEITLFIIIRGIASLVKGIGKHFCCLLKSDSVFFRIAFRLILIPFKFDALQSEYDVHTGNDLICGFMTFFVSQNFCSQSNPYHRTDKKETGFFGEPGFL